jgi:hypothetical protein
VKNQFFGDKRDYFKFSLLQHVLEGLPQLRQLTCVWMLTRATGTTHGNLPLVPLSGYTELSSFLSDARNVDKRDVREISLYYSRRCQFNSYGDDPTVPFGAARDNYFRSIPATFLRSAVVFVDPDNGLEPAKGAGSAHLKYEEAEALYQRLYAPAVLVVYQHLPRRKAAVFWPEVAGKIAQKLKSNAYYVAERDVALYLVPKLTVQGERLREVLDDYVRLETLAGAPSSRSVGLAEAAPKGI